MAVSIDMERAPLTARLLAALVDYILVMATVIPAWSLIPSPDLQFLAPLLCGCLYYSLGNSSFFGGQTLGKRLFGLKVRNCTSEQPFLSPSTAALRYVGTFGLLILGAEVPPLYFRSAGIVANPALLELPMLFILMYFMTNVSSMLFDPRGRALHDIFSGAVVLRGQSIETIQSPPHTPLAGRSAFRYFYFRVVIGILAALLFWTFSINHHPAVNEVARIRYRIERDFGVRLYSVGSTAESNAAQSSAASDRPTAAAPTPLKLQIHLMPTTPIKDEPERSAGITERLAESGVLKNFLVQSIDYYWLDAPETPMENRRPEPDLTNIRIPGSGGTPLELEAKPNSAPSSSPM